jgi:hypothetical protein
VPVTDLIDAEAIKRALTPQTDDEDVSTDTEQPEASTVRRSVWTKRAEALAQLESALTDFAD